MPLNPDLNIQTMAKSGDCSDKLSALPSAVGEVHCPPQIEDMSGLETRWLDGWGIGLFSKVPSAPSAPPKRPGKRIARKTLISRGVPPSLESL